MTQEITQNANIKMKLDMEEAKGLRANVQHAKDFHSHLTAAEQTMKRMASQSGGGGGGGPPGGGGGNAGRMFGQSGGGGGMFGQLGGMMRGAVPLAAISSGFALAAGSAKAYEASQDPRLTDQQKTMRGLKAIPGVGWFARQSEDIYRGFSGQDTKLREQKFQLEDALRKQDYAERIHAAQRGVGMEGIEQQARVGAAGRYGLGADPSVSLSTYQGRVKAEESYRRQAAEDEITRSKREVDVTKRMADEQRQRIMRAQTDAAGARGNAERAQGALSKYDRSQTNPLMFSDDAARGALIVKQQEAIAEAMKAEKRLQDEITAGKERGLKVSEAEHRLRQSEIGRLQTDLQDLQSREQRMSGAQRRLGAMTKPQYGMAKRAFLQGQRIGFENLMPHQKELARQFAPETVGSAEERFGAGRSREAAGLGGGEDYFDFAEGHTLEGTRRAIPQAKIDLRAKIEFDTQAVARELVPLLNEVLRGLIKSIKMEEVTAGREAEAKRQGTFNEQK